MRYLLDTGIAQEFIGRNAKVVQRVDGARRAGNRIGICTPVLVLQRWIGVPDFPSESAGTGLTSLKRQRRAFSNPYQSMPFASASGLL